MADCFQAGYSITRQSVTVIFFFFFRLQGVGVVLAQSGLKVVGSIPALDPRFLLVGSVSVECGRLRQKSWSPRSLLVESVLEECGRLRQKSWSSRSFSMWQHVKLSDANLGTCPRYSLVVDEDVKKP